MGVFRKKMVKISASTNKLSHFFAEHVHKLLDFFQKITFISTLSHGLFIFVNEIQVVCNFLLSFLIYFIEHSYPVLLVNLFADLFPYYDTNCYRLKSNNLWFSSDIFYWVINFLIRQNMPNKNDNNRKWVYIMGPSVGSNTRMGNNRCEHNEEVYMEELCRKCSLPEGT